MTDVETRTCWKCGQPTAVEGTYCENCGVHRNRNELRPDGFVEGEEGPPLVPNLSRPTTITAAGIALMATVLLLGFWFWVAVLVMAMFWEPEAGRLGVVTFLDYLDFERSLLAFGASIGLTLLSWIVAEAFVKPD